MCVRARHSSWSSSFRHAAPSSPTTTRMSRISSTRDQPRVRAAHRRGAHRRGRRLRRHRPRDDRLRALTRLAKHVVDFRNVVPTAERAVSLL